MKGLRLSQTKTQIREGLTDWVQPKKRAASRSRETALKLI